MSIINAQSLSIDSASIPEYEETILTKSIFPVVFYLPETRLGFGLTGIIAKDNYNDTTSNLSRISQIQPSIAYTINNQLLIYLPYELYFDKDNWKIKGELGYYKYFYSYYGIGTSALLEDKENYDVDYPRFEARITRRIRPTFSAGLIYRYDDYDIKRLESEGLLESRNTRGINGGTLSAFGALIEYDNRDDIFLPYKGGIGTATYLNSHDRFGSPYNFTKVDLGYSYYFSIKPEHILALDLRTGWINGDAPFYEYLYWFSKVGTWSLR